MSGDEPHPEGEPGTVPAPTAAAIIGGIVAIVVVLALVFQGGDDLSTDDFEPPATTASDGQPATSAARPSTGVERPEIPPVVCEPLWSDDELVLALGSEERSYSDLSSFKLSRGEVCLEELASDGSYFIKVEPGEPSDFGPGAVLSGVVGESIPDVGDEARWFSGTEGGDPAVLAVFKTTRFGELMFRLSIGRPDLTRDEQRPIMSELARAILPNFPYVEIERPAPTVIEFERETPPPLPPSLNDLVISGVAQGDWTQGEGLVEALRYLTGAPTELDAPTEFDLFNGSATGVILQALSYLGEQPDEAISAELEGLLADLEFRNRVESESSGQTEQATAGAMVLTSFAVAQDPPEESDEYCDTDLLWFEIDCAVREDIGGVRFTFPEGALEGSVEGWDIDDVEVTRAAIQRVVDEYTKYGTLIKVDVVFTPYGGPLGEGIPSKEGLGCTVSLSTSLQGFDQDHRMFFIAMEMAGCFLFENLPGAVFSNYTASKWWYQGLVVYLASEAYPRLNLEWGQPTADLEAAELSTSLQGRTTGNWPFFRSVASNGGGAGAAVAVVAPLTDAPTMQAQQDKLAAQSSSDPALHVFHQELTDAKIPDSGGAPSKYSPEASAEIELVDNTIVLDTPIRFGVTRYQFTVAAGMYACIEYEISDNVLTSWRSGTLGSGGGSWSFDLPTELTGEAVFVITTVEEGESFGASVEVSDEPDCEDDEDEPDDFELPDCGICDPSAFYRLFGALADYLSDN